MELQAITLEGFRRFAEKTEIRTNGKLVALLGPNEAGKTSILTAITAIGNTEPIEKRDLTRGQNADPDQVIISARFRLDESDLEAASITKNTWYTLNKKANGKRTYSFSPRIANRDITNRARLIGKTDQVRRNNRLWGRVVSENDSAIGIFEDAISTLQSTEETIDSEGLLKLATLSKFVRENEALGDPKYFGALATELDSHIEDEERETPEQIAKRVIFSRIPKVLFFENEDRLLEGSYPIESLSEVIPPALDNLAKVADLNLGDLIRAIAEDDTPAIAQIKEKANEELKKRFSETWSQSGVHVAFEVHNNEIQVLVREENYQYTKLAERSDGLRQFVALQSFTTHERVQKPILLIDEAEIRLHYDAQADLIQMLSRQQVSPKIIYTTHSAGCLPEDLGNGVRLVESSQQDDGALVSRVRNQFWNRSGGGLEPLLFGMGAATLAFFPIRRALLTEGESDMMLLPTMLREAYGTDNLTFQVVPGLSKTSGINLPILARNGTGVAFALDYDQGGRDLENKITGAGFDKEAIFFLRTTSAEDQQIEDFLNPHILAHAIKEAMSEMGSKIGPIKASDLKASNRIEAIRKHYKFGKGGEVPKTLIAYYVLDYCVNHPEELLVDKKKKKSFDKFAVSVREFLSDRDKRA